MKYILEYVEFDWMENHLSDARNVVHKTLVAETKEDAKREATELWRGISAGQVKQRDGKVYPREPRLRAEIAWSPNEDHED